MRCHVVSDLHLEAQASIPLPGGDVLIVAGDLCNASAFVAPIERRHAVEQRERVKRFADAAVARYAHVVMIAGNHEHYEGVFEDTIPLLRRHLPGFTILDDEWVEIGGHLFFGGTLWTDFDGRNPVSMEACRRGLGEYFFVRSRARLERETAVVPEEATGGLLRHAQRASRLQPADTLAAFEKCLSALRSALEVAAGRPMAVITHHAPSRQGLNPRFIGKGLDGAYASDLDGLIAELPNCPFWVHGHTHIQRRYEVGQTRVIVNCRGITARDPAANRFDPTAGFEL